ncbi:MAG: hypothetical protein ACM31F_05065 [Gemmatimonas sp.]
MGFIVHVMESRAAFLDVGTRVRSLRALEKRGERQEYLSYGEEEKRRPPERTG